MNAHQFIEKVNSYFVEGRELKVQIHPLVYQYLGLDKVTSKKDMQFMPQGYVGMLQTHAQLFSNECELLSEATILVGSDNVVKLELDFWQDMIDSRESALISMALDLVSRAASRYYKTKHFGMPHTSIVINGASQSYRNILMAAAVGIQMNETPVLRKELRVRPSLEHDAVSELFRTMNKDLHKYAACWTNVGDDYNKVARFNAISYDGIVHTDFPLEEIFISMVLAKKFTYSSFNEVLSFDVSMDIKNMVRSLYAKMRTVHYTNLKKEEVE